MEITLQVWRQPTGTPRGTFECYRITGAAEHLSFLEMLDLANEQLTLRGESPIAFDSDCREGICGACGMVIDGVPNGKGGITACQLHMCDFQDGQTITVEPWRARAFPVVKDLVVDRSALDRVLEAGGYISVSTGAAPEANAVLVPKPAAERAMDAAACIGCGACVAACPNASALLYTGAKVAHLSALPQGHPERYRRVRRMAVAMEQAGFGGCTNTGACVAVCPQGIGPDVIAALNRERLAAALLA